MSCIILIGGSFDPIHLGHMSLADFAHNTMKERDIAHHIYFLPTPGSPLKNTQTTIHDRITMVNAAIKHTPYGLDTREITQTPPVFTINTLKSIRKEYPHHSIIFIMGLDSLTSLDQWKNGMQLTDYCHLWVFNRSSTNQKPNMMTNKKGNPQPNHTLPESLSKMIPQKLKNRQTSSIDSLINHTAGFIFLDNRTPVRVSSSYIRNHLKYSDDEKNLKKLVSCEVWAYIKKHKLYRK